MLMLTPMLAFMAAQGAAVFATAFIALRLLKMSHWFAKIVAMALSYVAWISLTFCIYFGLGGEGGIMDGFLIVLFLCFTALISTGLYLLAWMVAPFVIRTARGTPSPSRSDASRVPATPAPPR